MCVCVCERACVHKVSQFNYLIGVGRLRLIFINHMFGDF